MEANRVELDRPIRVVVFTSGPILERGVRQFLCRLEDNPQIDLVACIAQSKVASRRAAYVEVWRRRGLLAAPIILSEWLKITWRMLLHPRGELSQNRQLAGLGGRIHYLPDIHAREVLDLVCRLGPDLGLIYGSPILKPALFDIPVYGTLGIHHGKVPEYRGKKTVFWAIFNGEETAGVTIQKVNAGLDTGQIVKKGEVHIGHRFPGAVWNELNDLGLDLYIRAILEVKQGNAKYQPQTGQKGKLYKDPSVKDIAELWRRIIMRTFQELRKNKPWNV